MAVGCFALIVLLFTLYVAQTAPWFLLVIPVGIAAAIVANAVKKRNNKIASIEAFTTQAKAVDEFAAQLEAGQSTPDANFALKAGETLLASQDNIKLLEWVSTGSTYQGGSAGFSFRVMRGVSYRVGRNSGQLVRNPPALKTVDVGTVNFTTERITFVGPRETRAYDVAKILDLNIDHNGQTVMISVSNRKTPSALQGSSFDIVGPGFLVQAALAVHNSTREAAAASLRVSANELRAAAEATRVELNLAK
jgi:hypothetical protein